MNLKRMTCCFICIFLLSTVASAQQATKADIQVLAEKINSLDTKITEMDKRLDTKITEMDKRLDTKITEMDKRLNNRIAEMDTRLTDRIDNLGKRLTSRIDTLYWAVGALIGIVLTVIALPQLLGYF